jgi:hypothetical protein
MDKKIGRTARLSGELGPGTWKSKRIVFKVILRAVTTKKS